MKGTIGAMLTAVVLLFAAYILGSIHGIQEGAKDATNGYRQCMHLPDGGMHCWLTDKGKARRAATNSAIRGTTQ